MLVLLILVEIFLLRMLCLVSAGPLLGQSIEARRITTPCPLAPPTDAKQGAREKFPSDFYPKARKRLKSRDSPSRELTFF